MTAIPVQLTAAFSCCYYCSFSNATALSELGISSMDTLIVAFPACPEEELTLDNMKPIWQVKTTP